MVNTEAPDIYHAIVKLRRDKKTARVHIRYSKRGKKKRVDFPFPDIDERDLGWKTYGGERIAVCHRENSNYNYMDTVRNSRIPKRVAQKLEILVLKAHSQNSE
jgi:hypothetical protein